MQASGILSRIVAACPVVPQGDAGDDFGFAKLTPGGVKFGFEGHARVFGWPRAQSSVWETGFSGD